MSMYVNKYYNDFLATVVIESDEIGAIDLENKEFRIDVIDIVTESAKAEAYQIALENEDKNLEGVSTNLKNASLALREVTYACDDKDYADQFTAGLQSEAGRTLQSVYNSVSDYADGIPSVVQLNRNVKSWTTFLNNWKEKYLSESAAFEGKVNTRYLPASTQETYNITQRFDDTVSSGVVISSGKFIGFSNKQEYTLIASAVINCETKTDASFNLYIDDKPIPYVSTFDEESKTLTYEFSLENFTESGKLTECAFSYSITNLSTNNISFSIPEFKFVKKYAVEPTEKDGIVKPGKPALSTYVDEIIVMIKAVESYAAELPLSYDNDPMLVITNKNSSVYCNADYESLLRNGMQYWIGDDNKSMYFRFIPQINAEKQFNAVHVAISFDHNNVVNFEISLLPRLITGDIHKRNETAVDPVLDFGTKSSEGEDSDVLDTAVCTTCSGTGEVKSKMCPICNGLKFIPLSSNRVDYIYNTPEVDNHHLYVNNTTLTPTELQTPVYEVNSSAYIAKDMVASGYGFDMKKINSYLYDNLTSVALNLPYKVRPFGGVWTSDKTEIVNLEPAPTAIKLVPGYVNSEMCEEANMTYDELNEIEVVGYEICQTISASGNWDEAGNLFVKNQVYLSMEV